MTLFSHIKDRKGRVAGTATRCRCDTAPPERARNAGMLAQNSPRGRGCRPDGRDQYSADLLGTSGGGLLFGLTETGSAANWLRRGDQQYRGDRSLQRGATLVAAADDTGRL